MLSKFGTDGSSGNPLNVTATVPGNVSAVQPSARSAFVAGAQAPSTATDYSILQLFNSAALGGVSLYVTRADIAALLAGAEFLVGTGPIIPSPTTITPQAKNGTGASTGKGQLLWVVDIASPTFTDGSVPIYGAGIGEYVPIVKEDVWIVPPSKGLIIVGAVVDSGLSGIFEWYEQ